MIKDLDILKYCLVSTYREKDNFYLKIHSIETAIPDGFSDPDLCFLIEAYPGQNLQEGKRYLRCSLVGVLYDIVPIPDKFKIRIQTIFDFM